MVEIPEIIFHSHQFFESSGPAYWCSHSEKGLLISLDRISWKLVPDEVIVEEFVEEIT